MSQTRPVRFLFSFLLAAIFFFGAHAQGVQFITHFITNLPAAGGISSSSNPSPGTTQGSNVYFLADDGIHGREVWKSDGTSNGTALFADLNPGAGDSTPYAICATSNAMYYLLPGFSITNHGDFNVGFAPIVNIFDELVRADASGTNVLAGPGGLLTTNCILIQGQYETQAGGIIGGAGSYYIASFTQTPLTTSSSNASFLEYKVDSSGGLISNILWRTDGTVPGSLRLFASSNAIGGAFLNNAADCFFLYGGLDRVNLATGGAAEQLQPAFGGGYTMQSTANNRAFFSSFNGGCGTFGLICSGDSSYFAIANGGSPVTVDSFSSSNTFPPVFGSAASSGNVQYYTNSFYPQKLFRTDGTGAGTLAFDFQPLGIFPVQFFAAGSRLFFTATTNSSSPADRLGVTDFTTPGTFIFWQAFAPLGPMLGSAGTNLLFNFDDHTNGAEIWVADGTANGTHLLKDIAAGAISPAPFEAVALGTNLIYSINTPAYGSELWKGNAAGVSLLDDIRAGTNSSSPTNLTLWSNAVYFFANDGTNGMELWKTDGSPAGTALVRDCRVGAAGSSPSTLVAAANQLFFIADDGSHGAELWRSDGTSNGTYMIIDLVPGLNPGQIGNLAAIGNLAYFIANSGSFGRELWFSDGTPGGTQFLADLNSGTNNSSPTNFTAFNGAVYFVNTVGSGFGLWRTDNTPGGTVLITNAIGGSLCVANNLLFATASGNQLWVSDGTPGGTIFLTSFPAPPLNLTAIGANVYFTINEDLWISDGTTNGTVIAGDMPVPNDGTVPAWFLPLSGGLLFTASTPEFGNELWCVAPGQPPSLVEDLAPGNLSTALALPTAYGTNAFYFARPAGNSAWELRSINLQNLNPPAKAPYNGSPAVIPGVIEAENFDLGGEGQGYSDTTPDNEGGQYRINEGVDIISTSDTGGGYAVFDTVPGEWLEYTFTNSATGYYFINMRVASVGIGADFDFLVDGAAASTLINLPDTGGPNNWTNVIVSNVPLSAGVHVLRLEFDDVNTSGDSGIYNWLSVTFQSAESPPVINVTAPAVGSVYGPGDVVSLQANVSSYTGSAPQVQFLIDGQSVGSDSSSPYSLNWAATLGTHVFQAVATDSFGVSTTSRGRLIYVVNPALPSGSAWTYLDSGANAGTAWSQPGFNDSIWKRGAAPFGFGFPSQTTTIDGGTTSSQHITTYFRRNLTTSLAGVNYATIKVIRDDAEAVFLNGQLVGRANLPKTVAFNTLAVTNLGVNVVFHTTNHLVGTDFFSVPINTITNGTNLFAVEVHQAAYDGNPVNFDLRFDLAFYAIAYSPTNAPQVTATSSLATVHWPDYLEDWTLQQSPDLVNWTNIVDTPVLTNGQSVLQFPVQSKMFFRLIQSR